jgi:hypothetical protein
VSESRPQPGRTVWTSDPGAGEGEVERRPAGIGRRLGLTRERVRQIQMDALKRLRQILEAEGLSEDALFE